MTIKTYEIPLHRKISEGYLKPSDTVDADLYLEVSGERHYTSNSNSPKAEIYSIDKSKNDLIIYSNTLGFKVTDIYYNTTPLFNFIVTPVENITAILTSLTAKIGSQFLTNYFDDSVMIMFNYSGNTIELASTEYNVRYIYPIFAPFAGNSFIKVRRLRDRLKVTVKGLDKDKVTVELINQDLLQPKVHNNNWVEFYECVIKDLSGNFVHIYNHSFEMVAKTEHQKQTGYVDYKVKDPVLNISYSTEGDYLKYEYESYRSNLLFNTEINSDLFFYINLNYENKTDLLFMSFKEEVSEELLEVFRINNTAKSYEALVNPYIRNTLYSLAGENFTVMMDTSSENKYNKADDIRFGNTKIILNTYNLLNKPTNYITTKAGTITQVDNYEQKEEVVIEGEEGLSPLLFNYLTELQALRDKLEGNLNYHYTHSLEPKSYFGILSDSILPPIVQPQ